MEDKDLLVRKERLLARLADLGITTISISHLPYLDHSNEAFQSPEKAGRRMMILYALAYSAFHPDARLGLVEWFKQENLWDEVSPEERDFLLEPEPDEDTLMDMSWHIEAALTLGWCLNMVESLPGLDEEDHDQAIDEFQENIPTLGDSLGSFPEGLSYRDMGEIYEENLLNELVTTHLRDQMLKGVEEVDIDAFTSYERHRTLNWLRKFMDNEEWDPYRHLHLIRFAYRQMSF